MTEYQKVLMEFRTLHKKILGFEPQHLTFRSIVEVKAAIGILEDYSRDIDVSNWIRG
jgi:hypothetical protein